ncbi:MAG: NAD kinase [Legionellaceae bacterium]
MTTCFKKIALFGRIKRDGLQETITYLVKYLASEKLDIFLEKETAENIPHLDLPTLPYEKIGLNSDLVIVIGGDGSLLQVARSVVDYNTPIIGINRGRLGFLTDIHPNEVIEKLQEILRGEYKEEERFFLTAQVIQDNSVINQQIALNEVVLMRGDNPHMMEFEIYIDEQFVCSQRADGLIVSTPTGSTAYALSGGGPILHPSLDACVLLPMFPHTLSSRPIVINGNSEIKIAISPSHEFIARLSCDGQNIMTVNPGNYIMIRKKEKKLRLLHPLDYRYFDTLRSKLQWETKFGL